MTSAHRRRDLGPDAYEVRITTMVPVRTYRALWDFHESRGERPWAYQFHTLARRRFAKELAACLW